MRFAVSDGGEARGFQPQGPGLDFSEKREPKRDIMRVANHRLLWLP